MNTMSILFLVIGFLSLFLIITLLTEGLEYVKYRLYQGKATATVIEVEPFTIEKSKAIVRKQVADGEYIIIPTTQDKSVHYLSCIQNHYLEKKDFSVLGWFAENTNWKANYPYLRRKGEWSVGEEVELHYSVKKPWKYAIYDKKLWVNALRRCVVCILLCFAALLGVSKGHFEDTTTAIQFQSGTESEIEESSMTIEEYWDFIEEKLYFNTDSNAERFFHDEEVEKAMNLNPQNIKKYTLSKNYNDCFSIVATAITWSDENGEEMVFGCADLLGDKKDQIDFYLILCNRIDKIDKEEMVFGFFRYNLFFAYDETVHNLDEMCSAGFSIENDGKTLSYDDSIMLIKELQD